MGFQNFRHVCPKMVRDFHPVKRVASGPSPMRGTIGVAVDGFVSPDHSLNYFACLLIVYNKIGR